MNKKIALSAMQSQRAFESPHTPLRPDRRCLSIVRVTWHRPVLGQPLVCRAATVVSLYRSQTRPFPTTLDIEMRLCPRLRPDRRCLSIVRVTRRRPVLGQPLVCRAATVVSLYIDRSQTDATVFDDAIDIEMRLCPRLRPDRRCLSIVRVTRHRPVLGQPLVCRAATVVSHYRSRICDPVSHCLVVPRREALVSVTMSRHKKRSRL